MTRPQKLTLDFFLHDVHAVSDRKIRRLMRKHGCYGYATYFVLLEKCCLEQGMKLDLSNPEEAELTAETIMVRDCQHLYAIVQLCADIGLFNKQLWESERVVFSDALHSRYVERLEQRKSDATRKRQSRAAKALQEKIDALNPELSGVTTGFSQKSHKGRPPTEDQKTEDQKTEDRDQKTETHNDCVVDVCVEVQPVCENKLLAMEDRWKARRENRKGSEFDLAWDSYQRNCIIVDRSPGNKAHASLAWSERFPQGATPDFIESLNVYWQQQLEKFKSGQQCIGVVGMLRFITEPEHGEQAIARRQLLAQAPQMASPKTAAAAVDEEAKARAKAERIARMEAKLAQEAS
jgi:hypothetical protein